MRPLWIMCSVVSFLAGPALAAPAQLPLQGKLTSAGGQSVDGNFGLRVRLYPAQQATEALHDQEFFNVALVDGVFSLVLGVSKPLDSEAFGASSAVWLGLKVEGDPELPRRQLLSTPYALSASFAGSATVAQSLQCTGCITNKHLASGALHTVATSGDYGDLLSKPDLSVFPLATQTLAGLVATCSQGQLVRRGNAGWECTDNVANTLATTAPQACDAGAVGQLYYDSEDGAVRICDGVAYRKIRVCKEICPDPVSVACGLDVIDDCGDSCEIPGTGLNTGQCAEADSAACGTAITDGCGNSCGVSGTQCAGLVACTGGQCTFPVSCKQLLAQHPGTPSGTYPIDPDGPAGSPAYEVTCDMTSNNGGWTQITVDYLRLHAALTTQTNASGEVHAFVDSLTKYYGYPNQSDYEVWNDFDVGFAFTQVRGEITWYPSAGSLSSWTQSAANPDNNDYGISVDTSYATLGVTGEGTGNKSWHRWGVPGKVIHAQSQLGWTDEWTTPKTTMVPTTTVPTGASLRFSTFSESGAPGLERWAFTPTLYVR